MNVLLTGSKGNLGQALQRAGRGASLQWRTVDRGQWAELPKLIKGCRFVIHAASDLLTPVWKDPEGVLDSNLMTTTHLLRACQTEKIERFVFISTGGVYGHSQVTKEEATPTPITINGTTKYLNEMIIENFCEKHGVPYLILRVFNTFGGIDHFSIISHLKKAHSSKAPFVLFNQGRSQRDFIHVDDVAKAVLALLEKKLPWNVMNVGSGETVRIREIVETFRERHPELELVHKVRYEAEYSRADISRLTSVLPDFQCRTVIDYIRSMD